MTPKQRRFLGAAYNTSMPVDPVLTHICEHLIAKHAAHTVILYGSRADGSATPDSDYDVIAFAPVEKALRDARLYNGSYLDIFIYPESALAEPLEEFLHVRPARVLLQGHDEGDVFLERLDALFQQGPALLPDDEIAARVAWINKMLTRMQRGDAEGNYRRNWLLFSLLEDYFHLRRMWYQGPKKSLAFLLQNEPAMHAKFVAALEPGASSDAIHALATAVVREIAVGECVPE